MKKNIKKFSGKRIYEAISGYNLIEKILVWNDEKSRYMPPPRGCRYRAAKYQIQNGNRKRVRKNFDNISDARDWQVSSEKKAIGFSVATSSAQENHEYKFSDLIDDFKKHQYPNFSNGTCVSYENRIKHFSFFSNLPVESIDPSTIDDWIEWLNSPEKIDSYQNSRVCFKKEYSCLRAILNWYIQTNDETKLRLPFKERHLKALNKRRKATKKIAWLDEEEYCHWLKVLKRIYPDVYPIAFFQKEQVKRIAEVCGMSWKYLDLKSRTYNLCESVEWLRIRGAKPRIREGTKTIEPGGSETLYLRSQVVEMLREMSAHKTRDQIFHNKGKLWSYREIQYRYDKAFKAAGLNHRGTHILRHTGATHLLNETGNELILTEMGGWKTTAQARHYGKVSGESIKRVLNEADQLRIDQRGET